MPKVIITKLNEYCGESIQGHRWYVIGEYGSGKIRSVLLVNEDTEEVVGCMDVDDCLYTIYYVDQFGKTRVHVYIKKAPAIAKMAALYKTGVILPYTPK